MLVKGATDSRLHNISIATICTSERKNKGDCCYEINAKQQTFCVNFVANTYEIQLL